MVSYKPRVIDEAITHRLKNKGAILAEGAKWCGKTTTCELLTGTSPYAYRREDGVYVVPVTTFDTRNCSMV